MIKFGIGIKVTGKTLTKLNHDLRIEMSNIRNDGLEKIRQQLMHEAPRKSKGNRWSENKIYNYLSKSTNCIRKRGRFEGYVVLDARRLPHLKYVVNDCKKGSRIYSDKLGGVLKICYPKQPKGKKCGFLVTSVKGHAGNDFINRAYIRSVKPIHYVTYKDLRKALYKK